MVNTIFFTNVSIFIKRMIKIVIYIFKPERLSGAVEPRGMKNYNLTRFNFCKKKKTCVLGTKRLFQRGFSILRIENKIVEHSQL